MAFKIRLGIPEFELFWNNLEKEFQKKLLSGNELKLFKRVFKTMQLLSNNPKHNGLCSHVIAELSIRYNMKVFQSYTENNTPSAGRLYWTYGPNKGDITIIEYSPHPDDSKEAYKQIHLSGLPIETEE